MPPASRGKPWSHDELIVVCNLYFSLPFGKMHARQNGQRLGRPLTAGLHADQIRKLHRAGISKAAIARSLRIGRTSVRRILKEGTIE